MKKFVSDFDVNRLLSSSPTTFVLAVAVEIKRSRDRLDTQTLPFKGPVHSEKEHYEKVIYSESS